MMGRIESSLSPSKVTWFSMHKIRFWRQRAATFVFESWIRAADKSIMEIIIDGVRERIESFDDNRDETSSKVLSLL